MRWTRSVRGGLLALLAGALLLPNLLAATVHRPAIADSCRCSNHACCARATNFACPLARAGQGCARTRAATTPGMRAGCGCHQGGEAGGLAEQKPGVFSALSVGFEAQIEKKLLCFANSARLVSPVATPEPPPPRAALRPA